MSISTGEILSNKKRIIFLTGTRADFGKVKSLMKITQDNNNFDLHIFATGMHMNSKYGKTVNEIYKSGFKNIYQFINHDEISHMDRSLAKTIDGFSHYIAEIKPDLIVVHGDRVEALAGAIVGSLNNILVAHIEGGELSGTIDELIRHSISKLSHIHLVGNDRAKQRLIQLGEEKEHIFIIGSPDLDLMNPKNIPSLLTVKKYYNIPFDSYSILMFHPITTEYENITEYAQNLVDAVIKSGKNYIVINPNNDLGSLEIIRTFKQFKNQNNFKTFPSLRFEYFLRLLKDCDFLIGNSSTSIHEAPYYNIPAIDIGTRQKNRSSSENILHTDYKIDSILSAITTLDANFNFKKSEHIFGDGNSAKIFLKLISSPTLWQISQQKLFQDVKLYES